MRLLPCKALLCLVSGERSVATWPLQAVKHGKNVLFGQEVKLAVWGVAHQMGRLMMGLAPCPHPRLDSFHRFR